MTRSATKVDWLILPQKAHLNQFICNSFSLSLPAPVYGLHYMLVSLLRVGATQSILFHFVLFRSNQGFCCVFILFLDPARDIACHDFSEIIWNAIASIDIWKMHVFLWKYLCHNAWEIKILAFFHLFWRTARTDFLLFFTWKFWTIFLHAMQLYFLIFREHIVLKRREFFSHRFNYFKSGVNGFCIAVIKIKRQPKNIKIRKL